MPCMKTYYVPTAKVMKLASGGETHVLVQAISRPTANAASTLRRDVLVQPRVLDSSSSFFQLVYCQRIRAGVF